MKAQYLCFTPGGPTPCCEDHGKKLRVLFEFMGAHVAFVNIDEDVECENCKNEEKKDAK